MNEQEQVLEGSPSSEAPDSKADGTSKLTPAENSEVVNTDSEEVSLDEQPYDGEYFGIDDVVNAAGYGKFQKILTFLAGLGWLADAFEVLILSIIGDLMACDWRIERWQNALLTSIVFVGMALGAPLFGNFADRYGRKKSLAISMILLFIFGAGSAGSPNFTWMIVLRGLMGFALGGIAQGVTLCCEYYPAKMRGRAGFYLSYYWSIGTIGVIAAAWIVMDYIDSWRIFVFVAALPALIVCFTLKWYPESARYYLVSNQPQKAMDMLKWMISMNKRQMPEGKLVEVDATQEMGKISDLLNPEMRRTTLLFWYIWLAVAVSYYGIVLITPLIIKDGSLLATRILHGNSTFAEHFSAIIPCKKFTDQNFFDLLWTTAAEFPGLLVFTMFVECCPRKLLLGTTCLMAAFLILFLMLEMKPPIALLLILFVVRALAAGIFQLLFIMTTEAFPTTLRASAMGTGSGFARFGGLIVPFLAQITVIARPIPSIFVLSAITGLAGVAALFLPMETKGKHMEEVIDKE